MIYTEYERKKKKRGRREINKRENSIKNAELKLKVLEDAIDSVIK